MPASIQHAIKISDIRWKKLFFSIIVWGLSEVGLTWLGLDDLADCGEYIYKHRNVAIDLAPVAQALPIPALVIPTIHL